VYDNIQTILQPVLAYWFEIAILALLGFLGRHAPAALKVFIEKIDRDALHKAINTGIENVLDILDDYMTDDQIFIAIDKIVMYIHGSVPDALRRLAPSEDQLRIMVRAKIQAKLAELAAAGVKPQTTPPGTEFISAGL
jgi:hypothetical protein